MKTNYIIKKGNIKAGIFHRDALELEGCRDCLFNGQCNKIQKKYIDKGIVKGVEPYMSKEYVELRKLLIDKAIKFNSGINIDGSKCSWLLDCREVLLSTRGVTLLSKIIGEKFKIFDSKYVLGCVLSGIPLVSHLVLNNNNVKGLLLRKEPKYNGLQKLLEGDYEPKDSVILVDDLVNSGSTMKYMARIIENKGGKIEGALIIVNFQNEGNMFLREKGYIIQNIYTLQDLFLRNKDESNKIVKPRVVWSIKGLNLWSTSVPRSTPTIIRDSVFFGTNEGKIMSVNKESGKLIWQIITDDFNIPKARMKGILSSPAVHNQNIFIGTYEGYLYCINSRNGKIAWKIARGDWIGSSPCIVGDAVYIGIEYGECWGVLISCSVYDGSLNWYLKTDHYIHSTPAVDANRKRVVVGCNDGYVYCANSTTGKLKWKFHTGVETRGGFAIDSEHGLVYFGSENGIVYCLDILNGKEIWSKKLARRIFNTPEIIGEKLVLSTVSKRIFCLDKWTGSIHWFYNTEGEIFSYTNTINGMVYCGSDDGYLYCIELTTGRLLRKYLVGAPILTKPLINNNKAYLGCKGMFACIDLQKFEELNMFGK